MCKVGHQCDGSMAVCFVSLSVIVSSLAGQSVADATDDSEASSTPLGI